MAPTSRICDACGSCPAQVRALEEKVRLLSRRLEERTQHTPPLRRLSSAAPSQTFEFELENPGAKYGKGKPGDGRPGDDKPGENDWETTEICRFWDLMPTTEEGWLMRRKSVLLSEPKAIIETVYQITGRTQYQPTDTRIGQTTTLSDLLRASQELALGLKSDNARLRQVSRFSMLLHVCLCRVAYNAGKLSGDAVDKYMNEILPTRNGKAIGSSHSKNLRSSVLWPIRVAEELRDKGLGNRAYEIFLLCKLSASTS